MVTGGFVYVRRGGRLCPPHLRHRTRAGEDRVVLPYERLSLPFTIHPAPAVFVTWAWRATGKTKRPPHRVTFCFGGPEGIRTLDLSDANRTLSQLSYKPIFRCFLSACCTRLRLPSRYTLCDSPKSRRAAAVGSLHTRCGGRPS